MAIVSMKDVSDDEGNDEEPTTKPDMSSTKLKEERQGREDQLRAMMDDDDQSMSNVEDKDGGSEEEVEPEPEPEPEPLDEPALKQASTATEKEEPPAMAISGGRRRGRRKVMKKITMKDDEGYLSMSNPRHCFRYARFFCLEPYSDMSPVTKEEPAWESYSEEDTPAPAAKPRPAMSSGKPKTAGSKGQGNIMSFFGKK
jgi:DNA polymerase delta subunit 3